MSGAQSRVTAGYLRAALQRPPSWTRPEAHRPTPGSRCTACRGTRWWSADQRTWQCVGCHPPDASAAVVWPAAS